MAKQINNLKIKDITLTTYTPTNVAYRNPEDDELYRLEILATDYAQNAEIYASKKTGKKIEPTKKQITIKIKFAGIYVKPPLDENRTMYCRGTNFVFEGVKYYIRVCAFSAKEEKKEAARRKNEELNW